MQIVNQQSPGNQPGTQPKEGNQNNAGNLHNTRRAAMCRKPAAYGTMADLDNSPNRAKVTGRNTLPKHYFTMTAK